MDALDLARLQFATTTIFHFFFVPLSIGLAFITAIMETAWVRTRDPDTCG
jgi:cytochrome d ubiquinol oxidase subunit I